MGLSTKPEPLKCPRCESSNTKFCYYNNYNKTQPRHFCKGCKRHWTEGGILRNVPVGGGRKNKRFKSDTSSTSIPGDKIISQIVVQSKQNLQNFDPLVRRTIDDKKTIVSDNIFYPEQNFLSSSLPYDTIENNNTNINTGHVPRDENMLVFSFSSSTIGSIEKTIPSFIPTSTQSSNVYNYMEESTVTTVTPMTCCSLVSQPWQRPGTSNVMDNNMPNYWNWNDIDALVSADPDILLDDDHNAEIKP